jgi:hypothetical protein
MIVHAIGSSCADHVQIGDNRAVTIKTFFSSALDTSSAADHPSKRRARTGSERRRSTLTGATGAFSLLDRQSRSKILAPG